MKDRTRSSLLGRILSVALITIILSSIAALAYTIAVPPIIERFTEFYLLGEKGMAADYPENLAVGEEAKVMVGITNREHEPVSYRFEVRIGGVRSNEVGPIALNQGQTWQETVTFRPVTAGEGQKVEFLLYRTGQDEVYRSVSLLVNVK